MIVTITSFSYKHGLPEEKMAIGNIGTGNIPTLAKLDTGRDNLQVAFGCTGGQHRSVYFAERMSERLAGIDGVDVEVSHVARSGWRKWMVWAWSSATKFRNRLIRCVRKSKKMI